MPLNYPAFAALLIAFTLSNAVPAVAQSDEDEQDPTEGDYAFDFPEGEASSVSQPEAILGVITAPSHAAAPATSASVAASISSATAYCKAVQPREYVIDCLAERLEELKQQLAGQTEFSEVSAVLETTSDKLNDIARQHRSSTLMAATFSTPGQESINTSRRLIPVDEADLETALDQAIAVIDEAQTMLLRSADQSAERGIEYQRISAAIGSNKVLLRSI